jgi:AcrR family transcriptional regulator
VVPTPEAARPYRSELRRRQAEETRLRVVQAAVSLFGRQGYRATTFAQLAQEAAVSVKTVQEHGPKSALLRAAIELASFGVEGESDFFNTAFGKTMLELGDEDDLAALVGRMMLAINAPSAGLWMTVVSAAHGDDELTGYLRDMLAEVRAQIAHVLRYVADRGWLRTDVAFDDLVEAMCILTCVETYVRFVVQDGKSHEAYQAFVSRTVRETVLAR